MQDINGSEIKTGQIVEIRNSYFKVDNGFYYVEHVPGDPTWCGKDISLKKICKNGKISKSNHICFWPIWATVSDPVKRYESNKWNEENAVIEIKDGVCTDYVRANFLEKADNMKEQVKYYTWNFGENSQVTKQAKASLDHYMAVANAI